ncbi:MurR/RpiR family transcriptional regulator [Undibacterium sp. TJN19]|uniref:MurR/RpiR family transcriptional regulator n=1 Tax=Undibacterium sp. TJN19 TaxID=3413055 RepID=UPI003BF1C52C
MKKLNTPVESTSPELVFARSTLGESLMLVLQEGSASYKRIANFLLRNQVKVTALGIEDMAEQCEVSTATISRFARDMGFSNYAGLRNQIAEVVQAVFQPVEKLRNTIESGKNAPSPAHNSMQFATANIDAANQGMSEQVLGQIVTRLSKAATVYVMGFGLSAHLAGILALHLQPFCPHVIEVVGYGGTEVAAGHLANISDKDVLIVISFPRYALDVIKLTQFVRDHSACIVTITDSPASPIAQLGDFLLLAPSTHGVLPSSSSAAIAVIEALVSSIMVSNKKNVEKAMRLTEAISAYLHSADNNVKYTQPDSNKTKK